jgi:GT2 family glycosyltransferase
MNQIPKVAIVILNWNWIQHLRQFLPSVMSSIWPNLEVIIGDNASTDGSIEFIRQAYPSIRIIENDQNYGFTGGYNRVLSQVEADYYILLNSDVEVFAGWIAPVIDLMESDMVIAVAAPKIRSFTQKNFFEHAGAAGGFIDCYGYMFCRGRIFYDTEKDTGQYQTSGEVFWASGAAMFIKKHCWDEAGGFDDRFFAHMEEIDLCWRLKNKGYKVMYCAESEVFHLGGGTLNVENPFKTFLNFRNNLLLLQNNLPFWRALLIIPVRICMDLLAIFRFLGEGKRRDAWAVSRAHQNFMMSLFKRKAGQPEGPKVRSNYKLRGLYRGSIVWAFFVNKKKHFTELNQQNFL